MMLKEKAVDFINDATKYGLLYKYGKKWVRVRSCYIEDCVVKLFLDNGLCLEIGSYAFICYMLEQRAFKFSD